MYEIRSFENENEELKHNDVEEIQEELLTNAQFQAWGDSIQLADLLPKEFLTSLLQNEKKVYVCSKIEFFN